MIRCDSNDLGRVVAVGLLLLLAISSTPGGVGSPDRATPVEFTPRPLTSLGLDPGIAARVRSLDPERVSERDVEQVLSRCPAPRILAFSGSVPFVSMSELSEFLIEMGYPKEALVNLTNGKYAYSSYMDGEKVAGMVAWHYEHEGLRPILLGHSQGGMKVLQVLYHLAGEFRDELRVWNPRRREYEDRVVYRDPITGEWQPVVGLRIGYASAAATGHFMRVLFLQWKMLSRLREVPDSVDEFTGFFIEDDLLGGGLNAHKRKGYRSGSPAAVRTVILSGTGHVSLPNVDERARDPETREWIQLYVPSSDTPLVAAAAGVAHDRVLYAAEIWFHVKKHWCLELQRALE